MTSQNRSLRPSILVPAALTLALGLAAASAPARAAVPDEVFAALLNRPVVLELGDGASLQGRLLAATKVAVVVERADGQVVSLPRARVERIRVQAQATEASRPESAGRPIRARRLVTTVADPAADTSSDERARKARLARAFREYRALKIRRADQLFNAGMGLTIAGVGMIVLAGVLHGVVANRACWDDACASQSYQMAQASLAFYIAGPIVAAAGIPMWIVGGVKGADLRERPAPQDPHHLRFEAAQLSATLPPSRGAFSWQLRF